MFTFNCARRSTAFAATVLAIFLSLTANSVQASQKSPEEVYDGRPNNLEILPEGAIRTKPIKLVVSFNLEYEPNSLAADQFLSTWYESISALPDNVKLEVHRLVSPDQFAYAVSLTFNNWEEYRTYESRPEFLEYYYAHWKPHVTEAEERVYILNTVLVE
jgi:hypothetical protein